MEGYRGGLRLRPYPVTRTADVSPEANKRTQIMVYCWSTAADTESRQEQVSTFLGGLCISVPQCNLLNIK